MVPDGSLPGISFPHFLILALKQGRENSVFPLGLDYLVARRNCRRGGQLLGEDHSREKQIKKLFISFSAVNKTGNDDSAGNFQITLFLKSQPDSSPRSGESGNLYIFK